MGQTNEFAASLLIARQAASLFYGLFNSMGLLTPWAIEPMMESLLFLSICICIRTGNTDRSRFKKTTFIIINRRRAQV
jgi:hypothetical protein